MDLEKIMTYQECDIKLRKLLDVIEKSEDSKRMEQAKQEFNLARQHLLEFEREAEKMIEFYSEIESQFASNCKKLEELELILENCEDDEQLPQLIADSEKLRQKISELERKISEKKQRSEKVIKDYKDAGERGRKMRDVYNSAKERQDALRKKIEPDLAVIKKQLSEYEPHIDKKLLEKYKSVTGEGKYPAFVEVREDGNTFSCTGCGLALSQKNKSELGDKGICSCENCRRIIFRK